MAIIVVKQKISVPCPTPSLREKNARRVRRSVDRESFFMNEHRGVRVHANFVFLKRFRCFIHRCSTEHPAWTVLGEGKRATFTAGRVCA